MFSAQVPFDIDIHDIRLNQLLIGEQRPGCFHALILREGAEIG